MALVYRLMALWLMLLAGGCASDIRYDEVPESPYMNRDRNPDEVEIRSKLPPGHPRRIPGGEEMGIVTPQAADKNTRKNNTRKNKETVIFPAPAQADNWLPDNRTLLERTTR